MKADLTVYVIYIILSNISKGAGFLHQGVTNCGFRKLVRYNSNRKEYDMVQMLPELTDFLL